MQALLKFTFGSVSNGLLDLQKIITSTSQQEHASAKYNLPL